MNPDTPSPNPCPKASWFGAPGILALALIVGAGATWVARSGRTASGCTMAAQSDGGMGCGMMGAPAASPGQAANRGKVLFYRNPMNPSITSPVFRKDEMGMDYLPVYAGDGQ